MENKTYKVKGMHCASCKLLIENVCKKIKGVKLCDVDFQTGKMSIEYDENFDFDFDLLKKEIENLGEYKLENN